MLNRVMGRLDFIRILVRGCFLAILSMTVYPILRYLTPPKFRLPRDVSVTAAKLSEVPPNTAKIFPFGSKPAILIHTASDEYKAFSAVCTHLNCTVQYDQKASVIMCACHNGRYGLDGRVISGPPPRPLEEYKVALRRDEIIVSKG
ncbi:MAG: Rieske (2Fe-2S) protein [Chlamydiae bacterium]|nr:Rieske (2Fe-2S) protein [Chlamydiota bacterium]MBI3265625.1 Rieske (2Fe-2S) protein [Chlamydiota bacterium]